VTEQDQPLSIEKVEPEFAAFVAIDWADKQHYWSMRVAGSDRTERGSLENSPESVEVWVNELTQRFAQRPIAIALEQRRGALVAMLSKYGQLHLYPVHPLTLSKYRQAWYPSRSKDDPKDADLLLEILTKHRDRLRGLAPDTVEMRLLQFQVENRRKLIDERTAMSNRLTDLLKIYFPQVLKWFDGVDSALVGDLLSKWPTLQALQKAKPSMLEKFFREHNCRKEEKIQERLEQIRGAIPATHDEAVLGSAIHMAPVWTRQIAVLRESIAELEKEIAQLAKRQQDWPIFDSFPGAGQALAPRLMAAMGTRRERFESADQLQSSTGIAPVKEASGNTEWVHIRRACPKFQRQTFHEWAACSLLFCRWAKDYYDQQRSRNKDHHVAVRALAFKWMRILYRCWIDRQPYREEIYLASLAKRNSLIQRLTRSVQMP
jgi:transposase